MEYLLTYIDLGIAPANTYDPEQITHKHFQRLTKEAAIGWLIADHKRRLGANATPIELARDVKMGKRYAYGAEDILRAWGHPQTRINIATSEHLRNKDVKAKAAQLDWEDHIYQLVAYLRYEMRFNATNATHHNVPKAGRKIVQRLENELNSQVQRYENIFEPINLLNIPEKITKKDQK